MKDLENAAIVYANKYPEINGSGLAYLDGAKSEAAKEYWQQGMYSKEILKLAWIAGYNKAVSSINEDRYDEEDNAPTFEQWFNNLSKTKL